MIALYYAGMLGIFAVALHRVWTTRIPLSRAPLAAGTDLPTVTLQIPVYNERGVVERILGSIERLRYPLDRLQIQILDDSTDETSLIVARSSARLTSLGFRIDHVRRHRREGFKAGALHAGLIRAKGQFVAIFDADFLIPEDFFERTLPHFGDPTVACVQARWTFLNENENLLTRLQGVLLHAHFQVEQISRSARGLFIHFNGTAGIWRKSALLDAGSFTDQSLTEDLDVSYRAQLRGWKIRYLPDVTAQSELPASFMDFKRQQARWATGSIQSLRNLTLPILASKLSWRTKLEAILHLSRHATYLFTFFVLVSMPWVVSQRPRGDSSNAFDALVFAASFFMVLYYFSRAPENRARGVRGALRGSAASLVGVALAPSMLLAILRGAWPGKPEFVRTPKGRSYRTRFAMSDGWDGFIAVYFWMCVSKLFLSEFWISKPMLGLTGALVALPFLLSVSKVKTAKGTP